MTKAGQTASVHGFGRGAPAQRSLEGFEPAPMSVDRLFFAALPDVEAAARIALLARQLRSEYKLSGKPLAVERFHVSLYFVGDYVGLPRYIVSAASDAAATIALPPFDVMVGQAVSFVGKRRNLPLVLSVGDGAPELTALQDALATAMTKTGYGQMRGLRARYTPHLTLLYDDPRIPGKAIEPIHWTVWDFVLVHSLVGRSRYVALARFPLRN